MMKALRNGGTVFASAGLITLPSGALAAISLDPAPPSMDASGLVSALGSVSDAVRTFIASAELVPDSAFRAIGWVGTATDWITVFAFAILLAVVGWMAKRIVETAVSSSKPFRRWLVGAACFTATGFVFHFALPVEDRSRAVSLALYLSLGFVALGRFLVDLFLQRAGLEGRRALSVTAAVLLGLIAFGYVSLGLMRLSGGPVEARLFVGMVVWIAMALSAARFLVLFGRSRNASRSLVPPLLPAVGHDPISHLLSRQTGWFFGTVLGLIVATTVVSALRDGPRAYLSGTLALLLLGALPAAVSLLPLPTISKDGAVQPWRATVRRCGRLLIFVAFWLILAWLFGIDLFAVASDRIGEQAVRVLIDVGVAVALGYLLWQVATAVLDSLASRASEGGHGAVHASSRIETFIPLLRTIAVAFIVIATGMIVLASMGVNIGPLLAGAGIFGIAIGFGSQALVKDVISGLFFLADDAFRLGEFIEVGSAKGTVESISIRSMKLRHSRGAVYTVPFGQVGVVNNQSRDWAIVKLEFLVDFATDLRQAKQIVRGIADDIAADEELGKSLLAPLKFQGVRRMEPFGMVVGVKFTAVPGEQFVLQREVYARVRDAFAEADIHFARPRVQVDPTSSAMSPGALEAAAATVLPSGSPPTNGAASEASR